MASFPAKLGWKRPRKSENKREKINITVPTRREIHNLKKIVKKFKI